MYMIGDYKDLAVSAREPMMSAGEVALEWSADYGSLVGYTILPTRSGSSEDEEMHTLAVFDARENEHSAPHFIVASLTGLNRAAHGRHLPDTGQEIQHVYEGEYLRVGSEHGRWLPRGLDRHERGARRSSGKGHDSRKVISDKQATFYIGEDMELHLLSEGYNPNTFIGYPNATEKGYKTAQGDYEQRMRDELASARDRREAYIAEVATKGLGASPIINTERYPRHAHGASHTRTVAHR